MHKLTFFLALATALVVLPACDAFGGGDPTIGGTYSGIDPAQGQRAVLLCNLKPAKMAGFTSNGMVLCAKSEDGTKVEFMEPPEGEGGCEGG